jgi:hypothetical protein
MQADIVPDDCTKVGFEDWHAQPGKALFAYSNMPTYKDITKPTPIEVHLVPGDPKAKDFTGKSPFSCSPKGLTLTLSNYKGQWQSTQLTTRNYHGDGEQLEYGVILFKVTIPPNPGNGLMPDVAEWAKSIGAYDHPYCWREIDADETNLGKTPENRQTTWHYWPGVCTFAADQPSAHAQVGYGYTGDIMDGRQHQVAIVKTPQWLIIGNDVRTPGRLTEIARLPIASRKDDQPIYGVWGMGPYKSMASAKPDATYSVTLNEIVFYRCRPGGC